MKTKVVGTIIVILILAGLGAAYQFRLFNRPPKADFEIKPRFINPTDETTIRFISRSSDPDGDTLAHSWYVDEKFVNGSKDHMARLTVGNHTVRLAVHDGRVESSMERTVVVERSVVYPGKRFSSPLKGIDYWSGNLRSGTFPSRPGEEDLRIVKEELGCNVIQFRGTDDVSLLNCAEIAVKMGFTITVVNLIEDTSRSTVDKRPSELKEFAKKAQSLLERSNSIVLSIGDEASLSCLGILSSETYEGRIQELRNLSVNDRMRIWPVLNSYLKSALSSVKEVFKGRITYNAGSWEEVDWRELPFDVAGMNLFFRRGDESYVLKRVKELMQLRKPFWVTATGCATFEDAYDYGGSGWQVASTKKYSQDAQAIAIGSILDVLNNADVDACFLANYKESKIDDRASFGVLRYNGQDVPFSRKLGFCMYKSYVLANPSSTAKSEFEAKQTIPSLPLASNWLTGTMLSLIQIQTASRNSKTKAWAR